MMFHPQVSGAVADAKINDLLRRAQQEREVRIATRAAPEPAATSSRSEQSRTRADLADKPV
jgi:hypothetical protein